MSGTYDVVVEKVRYPHGQHEVVGNLFVPQGVDESTPLPAVVVTHPFGGVKEQTAGIYARALAGHGYVTLAYDASHYGESGGEPRLYEVPTDRVEDIRCSVDFLSNHPRVDDARIGGLGVCAGGCYTVNAAQTDVRLKAIATVSAFDVGDARRHGVPRGTITEEARVQRLLEVAEARTREARGEEPRMINAVPASAADLTPQMPPLYREAFDYYCTPRGQHPNSPGNYVFSSLGLQMAFFPFEQIETISPRPLLMIAGDVADTRYFSEEAIAKAGEPKELVLVEGASHVDLYDREEYLPQVLGRLTGFFGEHL